MVHKISQSCTSLCHLIWCMEEKRPGSWGDNMKNYPNNSTTIFYLLFQVNDSFTAACSSYIFCYHERKDPFLRCPNECGQANRKIWGSMSEFLEVDDKILNTLTRKECYLVRIPGVVRMQTSIFGHFLGVFQFAFRRNKSMN